METKKIMVTIIDKNSKEHGEKIRYSFKTIVLDTGKNMTFAFWAKNEEDQKIAESVKKGLTYKLEYYDSEKEGITYHNIVDIDDLTEHVSDEVVKNTVELKSAPSSFAKKEAKDRSEELNSGGGVLPFMNPARFGMIFKGALDLTLEEWEKNNLWEENKDTDVDDELAFRISEDIKLWFELLIKVDDELSKKHNVMR